MTDVAAKQRIFRLFADMLEYPRDEWIVSVHVQECEALITARNEEAGAHLSQFRTFVEKKSLEQMKELYTVTFDLNATYHPYVGYHLLGETYKRSAFLLGLKECYRAQGFAAEGKELPDHLTVVLRFLAVCNNEDVRRELACEALLPMLEKMLKKKKERQRTSPYQHVLLALRLLLQQQYPMAKEVETHV